MLFAVFFYGFPEIAPAAVRYLLLHYYRAQQIAKWQVEL